MHAEEGKEARCPLSSPTPPPPTVGPPEGLLQGPAGEGAVDPTLVDPSLRPVPDTPLALLPSFQAIYVPRLVCVCV